MRTAAAAALTAALSYPLLTDAQTYQQSISEKSRVPCVRQALSTVDSMRNFLERATQAKREIQRIVHEDTPYTEKMAILMELPQKYGECEAMYGMFIPFPESFYKKMGREKPPLAGAYEEQAALVLREIEWYRNALDVEQANARHRAATVAYSPQKLKDAICNLPDPISADIIIGSGQMTGRIWPRFNGKYGDRSIIFLNSTSEQPAGSEYTVGVSTYTLVQRPGVPSTLVSRYGHTMSSEVLDALLNYAKQQEPGGTGWLNKPESICYDSSNRFGEFLRSMDSLGNVESLRFRYDRQLGKWYGNRPLFFIRSGLRASTRGRQKSVGAYSIMPEIGGFIDSDSYRLFLEDFDSWLSLGGTRNSVRITSTISRNAGPEIQGVADARGNIAGQMLVISEER